MTRLLFFLAAPFFVVLPASAVGTEVVTLGQEDQLSVQCAPATATLWAPTTVTQYVELEPVTSTVTVAFIETVVTTVTVTGLVTVSVNPVPASPVPANPVSANPVTSLSPAPAYSTTTSSAPQSQSAPSAPSTGPANNQTQGYRNTLYFTNWGIYGANYQPQQLPVNLVSHVLYAFADIGPGGEVKSSDTYADVQKHWPTDSWNEVGNNVYGCVKQLYQLKKRNRGMKVLLSIGGWTYSPKFAAVAATEAGRQLFASSATALVRDWGLDGIDIDYEYPATAQQGADFVKLLQACRTALDHYAAQHALGYHFLVTVAAPAGPEHYQNLALAAMDPWVDAWHIMTYDYAGSWDATTGHTANLFANPLVPQATRFSTDRAVRDYLAAGIPPAKISMGVPLYGRSFEKTNATVGSAYSGVGPGLRESGVWPYNTLPRPGATELYDTVAGASYSYDAAAAELISYDSLASARVKAAYLRDRGLGGAFFWEASGDRTGNQSLVASVIGQLGALEASQNWLSYPASMYDNLRAGMPGV